MVFVFVKKVRLVKYFSWGGFPRAKSAWHYGKPPRPDKPISVVEKTQRLAND